MNRVLKYLLFLVFLMVLSSCGAKEEPIIAKVKIPSEEQRVIEKVKYVDHNPFYPLNDKIQDLEFKLDQLRAQVLEYESKLHAPSLNADLLKLIKSPKIEHVVYLKNGNLIQGKIIQENADYITMQTRIGQIKVEHFLIQDNGIQEVAPLAPELDILPYSLEEQISETNITISGTIINKGSQRGDFVRIIYQFWGPEVTDTIPSLIDSVFVSGSNMAYTNGVISDSCLDPGSEGNFLISVTIPDSITISHWTKKIKSNFFE
jgi:hypothetical protein